MPWSSAKYVERSTRRRTTPKWDGSTQGLRLIGHGSAGMVFELDEKRVVKVYLGTECQRIEDIETERQAYRKLKPVYHSCRHVLRCYDFNNPHGLVLERCKMTARHWIRSHYYNPQTEAFRLATEAAKGIACIHDCGIRQGDVGCHNMLIDSNGTLKIADFAGSLVDDCRFAASVDYEVGSKLPGETEPTIRAEIFALGSAIYEMMTRKVPYKGRSYKEVQRLFKQEKFPEDFPTDIEHVSGLKSVAEKCWGKGGVFYENAGQVLDALNNIGSPSPASAAYIKAFSKKGSRAVVHQDVASPRKEPRTEKLPRPLRINPRDREPYVDSNRNKRTSRRHRDRYEVIQSTPKRSSNKKYHSERHSNNFVHSLQTIGAFFFGNSRTLPTRTIR